MNLNLTQFHLFWTLSKLTAKRVLNRRSTWLLLMVGLLPCGIFLFWTLNKVMPNQFDVITKPYSIYLYILSVYFSAFYVPLLAIFLGLGVISDEIESKNITFTLSRPVSRFAIAGGRYLGHLMAAAGLTVVSVGAVYFANMLFQVEDIIGKLPNLANSAFALCLGLAAYLSVVAALGTFLKRGAILLSILWMAFDTGFSLIPVETFHFISVKHRMLASFWDELPQFMLTLTNIQSGSVLLNTFWCLALFIAPPFLFIAGRLSAGDIMLSESK